MQSHSFSTSHKAPTHFFLFHCGARQSLALLSIPTFPKGLLKRSSVASARFLRAHGGSRQTWWNISTPVWSSNLPPAIVLFCQKAHRCSRPLSPMYPQLPCGIVPFSTSSQYNSQKLTASINQCGTLSSCPWNLKPCSKSANFVIPSTHSQQIPTASTFTLTSPSDMN